jgi:hypothetical protein
MVTLSGTLSPPPDVVVDWYRREPWKRWKHRLWDGREDLDRRRLPTPVPLVRGWALYGLQVYAGLGLRDALRAWNSQMPESRHHLAVGDGPIMGRENQASQERNRARAAADKLRALHSSGRFQS